MMIQGLLDSYFVSECLLKLVHLCFCVAGEACYIFHLCFCVALGPGPLWEVHLFSQCLCDCLDSDSDWAILNSILFLSCWMLWCPCWRDLWRECCTRPAGGHRASEFQASGQPSSLFRSFCLCLGCKSDRCLRSACYFDSHHDLGMEIISATFWMLKSHFYFCAV